MDSKCLGPPNAVNTWNLSSISQALEENTCNNRMRLQGRFVALPCRPTGILPNLTRITHCHSKISKTPKAGKDAPFLSKRVQCRMGHGWKGPSKWVSRFPVTKGTFEIFHANPLYPNEQQIHREQSGLLCQEAILPEEKKTSRTSKLEPSRFQHAGPRLFFQKKCFLKDHLVSFDDV